MSIDGLPLYRGSHEQLASHLARGRAWKEFLLIYYEGAETVLGADAHRGVFSEHTSRVLAGLFPGEPPESLLQSLRTDTDPADESPESIERARHHDPHSSETSLPQDPYSSELPLPQEPQGDLDDEVA